MPDAVNTNALQYKYANPIPGSVASGSSAVSQATEASHFDLNPAWKNETYVNSQQQEGIRDPETPDVPGASDLDNPAANENLGDVGPPPTRP